MPQLEITIDKFSDTKFCDLSAEDQKEFLSAIAERSAYNALRSVGLDDPEAMMDMQEIRSIIKGYRVARRAVWSSLWKQIGKTIGIVLTLLLIMMVVPKEKAIRLIGFLGL